VNEAFSSPSRWLAACRLQREGDLDLALPLSPVEVKPCGTPDCHCRLSHRKVKNELGLTSAQQSVNFHYEYCDRGKATRAAQKAKRHCAQDLRKQSAQAQAAEAASVLLGAKNASASASSPATFPRGPAASRMGSPAACDGLALLSSAITAMDVTTDGVP